MALQIVVELHDSVKRVGSNGLRRLTFMRT
jgi:hypothetical protein